jgi:predicted phosphatase
MSLITDLSNADVDRLNKILTALVTQLFDYAMIDKHDRKLLRGLLVHINEERTKQPELFLDSAPITK